MGTTSGAAVSEAAVCETAVSGGAGCGGGSASTGASVAAGGSVGSAGSATPGAATSASPAGAGASVTGGVGGAAVPGASGAGGGTGCAGCAKTGRLSTQQVAAAASEQTFTIFIVGPSSSEIGGSAEPPWSYSANRSASCDARRFATVIPLLFLSSHLRLQFRTKPNRIKLTVTRNPTEKKNHGHTHHSSPETHPTSATNTRKP